MKSFSTVTIGVANMNVALDLWHHCFGFKLVVDQSGADEELSKLRGIDPSNVKRQAILQTPQSELGMIHLIEFNQPGKIIRDGAQVFDWCPKNLDLFVQDMPTQVARLKSHGYTFRNEQFSEMTMPDGTQVREIHMTGHDHINIVLLEVAYSGIEYTEHGFSGIGPLVTIVPDSEREKSFYTSVLGLKIFKEYLLDGPKIEEMIGLPSGSALNFSILGCPSSQLGRVEVIHYQGVSGNDLYQHIEGHSLGIQSISYNVDGLEELVAALDKASVDYVSHGAINTLHAVGQTISFASPSGFKIEATQAS